MKGTPALIALGIVAAALAFSGQPTPEPAQAAPVTHDYAADIAKLQAELDMYKAVSEQAIKERNELRTYAEARDADARKYQDAHDRLLLDKQSSLTPQVRPTAPVVTYVSAGVRGVCANGSCGTQGRVYLLPRRQEPAQYEQPRRFRSGGWYLGKRLGR